MGEGSRWVADRQRWPIPLPLAAIGRSFDVLLDAIVGSLVVAMVSVAILQVALRYGLERPLPWPEEFIRWCFLWLVFLGGALALRAGGHIRVDTVVNVLPARIRPAVELGATMLTAIALGLLVAGGLDHARATTVVSANFGISLMYLFLAIPVGSALTLLYLARQRIDGVLPLVSTAAVVIGALAAWPLAQAPWDVLGQFGPTLVVVATSVLLMALGMPIAYALVLAAFFAFWTSDLPSIVVVGRLASTIATDFILAAIPFFLLMGALMNVGGVTSALIRAAATLVGHWRGGLGQVNVVTSTMLGGLSGSSTADAAAVTKTLVPEMERHGYDRAFAAAITAASSIIANLLPPSIAFLIYASLASVSVGTLFMAGVVPGLLVTIVLMVAVFILSRGKRHRAESGTRAPARDIVRAIAVALPALFLPVMILGSLRAGVVTPTEAGALAALYAFFLGILVYRCVNLRTLGAAVLESGRETSVILLLIAGSAPVAWLLIVEGTPQKIAEGLGGIADSEIAFLLLLNLFLLFIGLLLEPAPAMVILVPILIPITHAAGIDPIHLGVIVVLNLMIGSLTPPVGILAFVPAAIAKVPVMKVFASLIWFEIALLVVLLLVTFIPMVSLWFPELVGF